MEWARPEGADRPDTWRQQGLIHRVFAAHAANGQKEHADADTMPVAAMHSALISKE